MEAFEGSDKKRNLGIGESDKGMESLSASGLFRLVGHGGSLQVGTYDYGGWLGPFTFYFSPGEFCFKPCDLLQSFINCYVISR